MTSRPLFHAVELSITSLRDFVACWNYDFYTVSIHIQDRFGSSNLGAHPPAPDPSLGHWPAIGHRPQASTGHRPIRSRHFRAPAMRSHASAQASNPAPLSDVELWLADAQCARDAQASNPAPLSDVELVLSDAQRARTANCANGGPEIRVIVNTDLAQTILRAGTIQVHDDKFVNEQIEGEAWAQEEWLDRKEVTQLVVDSWSYHNVCHPSMAKEYPLLPVNEGHEAYGASMALGGKIPHLGVTVVDGYFGGRGEEVTYDDVRSEPHLSFVSRRRIHATILFHNHNVRRNGLATGALTCNGIQVLLKGANFGSVKFNRLQRSLSLSFESMMPFVRFTIGKPFGGYPERVRHMLHMAQLTIRQPGPQRSLSSEASGSGQAARPTGDHYYYRDGGDLVGLDRENLVQMIEKKDRTESRMYDLAAQLFWEVAEAGATAGAEFVEVKNALRRCDTFAKTHA